jgi:hypothetical protein
MRQELLVLFKQTYKKNRLFVICITQNSPKHFYLSEKNGIKHTDLYRNGHRHPPLCCRLWLVGLQDEPEKGG